MLRHAYIEIVNTSPSKDFATA